MRQIMGAQAILEAMKEEMERDENVVLIGEDVASMGSSLGTSIGFAEQFGVERVIDVPICEASQGSLALGMSHMGKRVILEYMMGDFSAYAFDSIVNQIAKQRYISSGLWKNPITIRMSQGAGIMVGAHHSQIVKSWYTNVPGLKIVAPTFAREIKGILKAAIREDDPVLVLEPKCTFGVASEVGEYGEDYVIEIGKARIAQEGSDVTIISYQYGLLMALDAAEELEEEGISCEVIDLISLIPYDKQAILESVRKTGRAVVVHEGPKRCGFGGEIAAMIAEEAFDALKAPIIRIGGKNCPVPYGLNEDCVLFDSDEIVEAIEKIME